MKPRTERPSQDTPANIKILPGDESLREDCREENGVPLILEKKPPAASIRRRRKAAAVA
jgi:hypothetical protein